MTNPIQIALNNASRTLARWLTIRSVIHMPSQVFNRISQPIMNIPWSAWKWSISLVLCDSAMLVQHANAQNSSDEKSNVPAQFALSPNAQTSERQTTAIQMCPPQQPTGVTAGACKPCITGVDCAQGPDGEKRWHDAQGIDFGPLWHGEYIGPIRLPSLLEYRVRINDEVLVTYIPNRQVVPDEYKLTPGDELNINSVSDEAINRDRVQIQPDGTIVVPLIVDTRIMAAGKSIGQLRRDLEVAFKKYISNPAINVEPFKVNTAVEDLKDAVNGPFAAGGRVLKTVVNPDGRIQLVGIGSVYVLGMTLEEIKRELNLRYRSKFVGIEVEPRLSRTAPHFLFVFGEVATQGRFEMNGPTTVTQGLALAGGLKLGANNRQVVIFRRAEDWRLVSTMLDLRGGQLGKRPNPSDEIWLRDSDLIIVPPTPIKSFGNAVQQVFTDGLYRIVPFQVISLQKSSF